MINPIIMKIERSLSQLFNRSQPKKSEIDNKQSPAHIGSKTLILEPVVWVKSMTNLVSFLLSPELLTVLSSHLFLSFASFLSDGLSVD